MVSNLTIETADDWKILWSDQPLALGIQHSTTVAEIAQHLQGNGRVMAWVDQLR